MLAAALAVVPVGSRCSLCPTLLRCVLPVTRQGTVRGVSGSCRGGLAKPHRSHYLRTYPCVLVQPNGSTYTIRYKEPRCIIILPKDLSHLSDTERSEEIRRYLPKEKIVVRDQDYRDTYDSTQYVRRVKGHRGRT